MPMGISKKKTDVFKSLVIIITYRIIIIIIIINAYCSCTIKADNNYYGDRGSTVVKVLCYKPEGRWFDPSWCHWNISLI